MRHWLFMEIEYGENYLGCIFNLYEFRNDGSKRYRQYDAACDFYHAPASRFHIDAVMGDLLETGPDGAFRG